MATTVLIGMITIGGAATAAANPNPNGTGQPNQSCQTQLLNGGETPGQSAGSPGSVFNEPGFGSVNGGTGGNAYNNARQGAGAPSQYDVACYQQSQHG